MKASELKALIEEAGTSPYFFDRKTMKFFGDTMANYGVREATIKTPSGNTVKAYELYRRNPVKHGITESAYFDKKTLQRVFKVRE